MQQCFLTRRPMNEKRIATAADEEQSSDTAAEAFLEQGTSCFK
jgi:hypothetical protein